MRISNESKIGIIAIAALAILFFGFAFLKGKNIFQQETKMYAVYDNVLGLKSSNKVVINGVTVGKITDIDGGRDMRRLVVTITFSRDVDIPENSRAVISPDLIGSTSLEIKLGDALKMKHNGDTLETAPSSGAINEALKVINPVLYEVGGAASSLDSLLNIFAAILDTTSKNNIKAILTNVNLATLELATTSEYLRAMMNPESGAIVKTIDNTRLFTENLNKNNKQIDSILTNINSASEHLAQADLRASIDSLNRILGHLSAVSAKINDTDGSLGLLLNDDQLYNQLESAAARMNILLDDIRVHPRRYVNFSIFGKKDRKNFLTAPLTNDTLLLINTNGFNTPKPVSRQ